MIPAMGVSAGVHLVMLVAFALIFLVAPGKGNDANGYVCDIVLADDDAQREAQKDRPKDSIFDPTNPFSGDNAEIPLPRYENPRVGDKIVFGPAKPDLNPGGPDGVPIPPDKVFDVPPGMGGIGVPAPGIGIFDPSGIPQPMPGGIAQRLNGMTRWNLVEKGGGNKASERAVALGLMWLAKHQSRDGHWAMDDFQHHAEFKDGKPGSTRCDCEGSGLHDDIAGTGFALLAFLGAGLTPENGKGEMFDYTKQIKQGLDYLREHQRPDGRFSEGGQENEQLSMYNHAIATICMCEAATLCKQDALTKSAQDAVDFLAKAQEPKNGGWRYSARPQDGDTSVVGWCVMALKSGELAKLKFDPQVLPRARHFFDTVELRKPDRTLYGYTDPNASPEHRSTLTSIGLLCRMYLGWKRDEPRLVNGWRWLKDNAMPGGKTDLYMQYYATQVMHNMAGMSDADDDPKTKEFRDGWKEWNERMRDMLIKKQDQGTGGRPHQQGSWAPGGDRWCSIGGRVMMTSLCIMTLEVYYRHLPLYGKFESDR
jgi:hypothetical protein